MQPKELAEALQALEGMPGWEAVVKKLQQIQGEAKNNLVSKKKTRSMADVQWYQARHDAASEILNWHKRKVESLKNES